MCGIAEQMGMIAEGIEKNPTLFLISKQMFPEIKFNEMDCLDFKNYCNYDIIYYWLPFYKPELKELLKKRIEDEIKVGGYIILGEEENQNTGKDERFISLDDDKFHNKIWKKIRN
jgi:chemotaxis methyl-accepting protein methylase